MQHQIFLLNQNFSLTNSQSFLYRLRYNLAYLVLGFLDARKFNTVSVSQRKRDKALSACMRYIDSNTNEKITISQLIENSDMSERTIQLAFLEQYGISPKEYINSLKLNDVRTKLI